MEYIFAGTFVLLFNGLIFTSSKYWKESVDIPAKLKKSIALLMNLLFFVGAILVVYFHVQDIISAESGTQLSQISVLLFLSFSLAQMFIRESKAQFFTKREPLRRLLRLMAYGTAFFGALLMLVSGMIGLVDTGESPVFYIAGGLVFMLLTSASFFLVYRK